MRSLDVGGRHGECLKMVALDDDLVSSGECLAIGGVSEVGMMVGLPT